MNDFKFPMSSKVYWMNGVIALVFFFELFGNDAEWVQQNPTIAVVFGMLVTVGNLVVRRFTSKPLRFTKPK